MNNSIFLKRLELQGFKSFATKTILDFPSRVAGIVGPNGSGKSNVIDALRWVLGEREAKQLRGDVLENLIFAGTPKRPAVGLAKVTLYFDNSSGMFPYEAPEVALQRRVDRSGASEFSINGEEVRLRDLVSMLARAKLGARGLTMIGQGQSDMFVKSTPDERRMMIEEVLGLKEFRIKKNQAERRLATSQINMDKTKAMLEELLPHLRFLRRQKHKWDKRSEVEKELKDIEDAYYAFRYRALAESMHSYEEQLILLEKEKKEKEREVEKLQSDVRGVEEKTSDTGKTKEMRDALSHLNTERLALERSLARLEVRMEFESKEKSEPLKNAEELSGIIQSASSEIQRAASLSDIVEIKAILKNVLALFSSAFSKEKEESQSAHFEKEREDIKTHLENIAKNISDLEKEEEEFSKSQHEANKKFREHIEILESKKNEERNAEEKIRSNFFEREKLAIRMGEIEREWIALGREISELKSLPAPKEHSLQEGEMDRKILKLRAELASIGEIDQNLITEATEGEKRYEFLSGELKDLERATEDLKKLIKDLEEKIHGDFKSAFRLINEEFNKYFRLMFGGGKAKMLIEKKKIPVPQEGEGEANQNTNITVDPTEEEDTTAGIEIDLNLPKKKITSLEMLSGGEKSLVSIAALFALIAVSPPPFLVLDEVDAALDEPNAKRFADLVSDFSTKTQFIIVTHNRATMEAADVLYGVTMADDGVSKILSLKFEDAPTHK